MTEEFNKNPQKYKIQQKLVFFMLEYLFVELKSIFIVQDWNIGFQNISIQDLMVDILKIMMKYF
uniref:Uncharacterized protein n=2 Tax=Meloidogyne enterolobii TaxID=390850 RepID=A0A6V7U2K7_MELEN|nr:unnamed protein product [Meloidogyne enterolobii]